MSRSEQAAQHRKRFPEQGLLILLPLGLRMMEIIAVYLPILDMILLQGTKGNKLKRPMNDHDHIAGRPRYPLGKELRDSFERVREQPVPDKLKDLIADLKQKEKERHKTQESKSHAQE